MATQNLISAELVAEKQASIIQKLKEILAELDFLISLQTDEVQGIFKAGNNYLPFIDKAHYIVTNHPEILPPVFDVAEFMRDYALAKHLAPIVNLSGELLNGLQKTHIAVNSDLVTAGLEVYSISKINRDHIPGLGVIVDEMATFFPRTGRKKNPTLQPASSSAN